MEKEISHTNRTTSRDSNGLSNSHNQLDSQLSQESEQDDGAMDGFTDVNMDQKIRPEHILNISAELLLDFS